MKVVGYIYLIALVLLCFYGLAHWFGEFVIPRHEILSPLTK